MTDIGVYTTALQAEDLSWDLSNPGVPYVEGGTLDITLFTQAQHYPNGYIPSGTVLGKVTAPASSARTSTPPSTAAPPRWASCAPRSTC
jgi:hypothetical protein